MKEVKGRGFISAKIIADSISPDGKRITTYELEYPRFIHGEFMTHRLISRNAASSRAIPVEKMLLNILDKTAMPIHWGKNKSGMQADEELREEVSNPIEPSYTPNGAGELLENKLKPESAWRTACSYAVQWAKSFSEAGYHKQIVNRLTEPFQTIKVVATATEWDNFFSLRRHKDAQPEIQELANCMWEALQDSVPQQLSSGEWHLPYFKCHNMANTWNGSAIDEKGNRIDFGIALKISASCCAQVSYRSLDTSVEKAIKIYDALVSSKPVHASPFEHQAKVMVDSREELGCDLEWEKGVTHSDRDYNFWSGNFKGFIQHRQLLEEHTCWEYRDEL